MAKSNLGDLPPVTQLRAALVYDPGTGLLRWRWRDDVPHHVNRCFAGKRAGKVVRHGHMQITLCGRVLMAHRVAWALHNGEWPSGEIDHINRVTSDNRIQNLRLATRSQNTANTRVRSDSSTGVKGVQPLRKTGRFVAAIREGGKRRHLGCFSTIEEAQAAYAEAARRIRGEFAYIG